MRWLPILVLGACVPMEPSGNMIAPAPAGAPAPVVPRTVPGKPAPPAVPGDRTARGAQGDFDFEAEDRDAALVPSTDDPATGDPVALQAKLLGISPEEARLAAARPSADSLAVPAVAAPIWDPSVAIPEVSFGIRVLAVVLDLQPPRAVISLPDGREQVVTPGAMLPADGLVVLAIGRDAVQVAKVTPSGFYARVETDTIRALYPSQPASP